MKIESQNFIISGSVYPFDIMFSINQSDSELKKSLKPKCKDWKRVSKELILSESSQGRTLMTNGNQTIVRLCNYDGSPKQLGILSHEIFHACTFILQEAGVVYTFDISDEAYAYLIGWITQSFFENILT